MRLSFVGLLTAWTAIVLTMAGCGSSGGGEGGTVSGDDNDGSVDLGFDSGPTLGSVVCTPKTCAQLGYECGPQGDGCGKVIECGECPQGSSNCITYPGPIEHQKRAGLPAVESRLTPWI